MMIQKYVEQYNLQPKFQISWLDDVRKTAIRRFETSGFPTSRMEEWKDTNLTPITGTYFSYPAKKPTTSKSIDGFWKKFPHILFHNGFHVETKINIQGVTVQSFKDGIENPDNRAVFTLAPKSPHAFYDLNTSLVSEGVVLHVEKNISVEDPIYLVYVSDSKEEAHYYRNLIRLETSSKAHVIEVYVHGSTPSTSLTIPVTQIQLGSNSSLEHICYQNEGLSSSHTSVTIADLQENSQLATYSFSFGGGLTRNDIQIGLNKPGAECIIDGLYVGSDKQIVDHHTVVDHAKPHCTSSQNYKGVLLDESHGIFEGKVLVDKEAQKTDAKQLNQNLILSPRAQIHTAPQLQILANDVKCAHGATIGKLDEDQIFYMRARGIDNATSRKLLVNAFASEVVSKIQVLSAAEEIQQILSTKISNL